MECGEKDKKKSFDCFLETSEEKKETTVEESSNKFLFLHG